MEAFMGNGALKSSERKEKGRKKNKKPKQILEGNSTVEQAEEVNTDINFTDGGKAEPNDELANCWESKGEERVMGEKKKEDRDEGQNPSAEENQEEGAKGNRPSSPEKGEVKSRRQGADSRKEKKRKRLLEEAAKADKRGICYLSRIPPHMDHVKLRQILSQYGEIQRIYLAPEDPAAQVQRKRAGGFRGQEFSEGWVEFTDKHVAKRVANMLNGEQIGGRKRSSFYYDIWNIKYLSKFKWDDLTEEIAYKNAIREQKLALEISAAKRERDFYLSKVDQSRALSSIKERMRKKQMIHQDSEGTPDAPGSQQEVKVIRQFPQTRPVVIDAVKSKPRLSRDVLAGVFGGS